MAKRTNKTDHVLNLLSSGKKSSEPEVEKEKQMAPPPVNPEPEQGAEPETSVHPVQEMSNVSVVEMSSNDENPIADSVKESLEEELNTFIQQKEDTDSGNLQEETEAEPMPETLEEAEQTELSETEVSESEPTDDEIQTIEKKEEPLSEAQQNQDPIEEEQIAEAEEENSQQEEAMQVTAESQESEADEEDVDYSIVNVMEHLVRSKVVDYMRQFEHCTCLRCIEDTVALSLTHLPAKYVVVNKEAISPLLNFYEKKYAGQIIVEITKACMRVDEFPHHEE